MKITSNSNNSISINGNSFSGRSVSISSGVVTIDGIVQKGDFKDQEINIVINGNVESIDNSSGEVRAKNVGSVCTQSGDVYCSDVGGSVSTMSGSVDCYSVGGSVSTMSGNIKHSK
tara:strand:- start:295 stop:642 length:348 start_codon:yes stop_codon:yes gene_type:complete